MKPFVKNIVRNFNKITIVLLFLVSAVIVALLLPREGRFNYEYHRGRPWTHESLSAKFRFPIHKTEEELRVERDSILKDLNYYFVYNEDISRDKLNLLKQDFEREWIYYTLDAFNIINNDNYIESNRFASLRRLQAKYDTTIFNLLKEIYEIGIISYVDIENIELTDNSTLIITRGNNAEETLISQLSTPKMAYQSIRKAIEKMLEEDRHRYIRRYKEFFEKFNIEKYIITNTTYDPDKTEKEKIDRLSSISFSKGRILEGERIISEGEIVTQEKYQVLESLKEEYALQKGNINDLYVRLGKMLFILICFGVIFTFLQTFRKEVITNFVHTAFILCIQVLMIVSTSLIVRYDLSFIYLIPYAILPIIIRIFFDERLAFFIHVMTVLIAAIFAPNSYEFVVLNIIAGMIAILSLTNLYRRSRFFISAIVVILSYCFTYFSISVVLEGNFSNFEWKNYTIYFPLNGLFVLLSFLLVYVFEKLFGFLSDTTLMELSDTNQPLLRKLAELAPGTFQHSMQVANLAEEVANVIGGNPMLVRTGAYYHDIGKISSPEYFTENQDAGFNPHEKLEYKKSAEVIIDHIIGGIELARKHKLPDAIIDFIKTHQGTATVQYFYRKFKMENPDRASEQPDFKYPGPRPQTKEHAILMMADTIEAASRSLSDYTENAIDELVETLINVQIDEGQYEEADITFKEINMAKEVFKARLKNIYHARIAYPKK